MTVNDLLLLFISLVVLAITPGAGALLVIATTVRYGWRLAIATIIGIVSADYIFISLVFFGIAAIAQHFYLLFTLLQWFGVVYIGFLGVQLFFVPQTNQATSKKYGDSYIAQCILGCAVTLGNPKAIIYYSSVLPTVISTTAVVLGDYIALLLVTTVAICGTMSVYCYLAHTLQARNLPPNTTRRLRLVAAVLLIGTAALLAMRIILQG